MVFKDIVRADVLPRSVLVSGKHFEKWTQVTSATLLQKISPPPPSLCTPAFFRIVIQHVSCRESLNRWMLYLHRWLEWPSIVMPRCQCHRKQAAAAATSSFLRSKAVVLPLAGWLGGRRGRGDGRPRRDRHGEEGGADHGQEAASLQGDHPAKGTGQMFHPGGGGAAKAEGEEGGRGADLYEAGRLQKASWGSFTCCHCCCHQPRGSPLLEPMLGKLEQRPAHFPKGRNLSAELLTFTCTCSTFTCTTFSCSAAGHSLPSLGFTCCHL